jgi:hypothetical protein
MLLPLIIALVVTLPFDQILEAVVAHPAVQYSLDLILFLTQRELGVGVMQAIGPGWDLDVQGTA